MKSNILIIWILGCILFGFAGNVVQHYLGLSDIQGTILSGILGFLWGFIIIRLPK